MNDASANKKVFELEATVKQWDDDYYHPIALKLYDRAIADMLVGMGVPNNATVLDAGCGPGVHAVRVARAGHRVHAIDISDVMLQHARKRMSETGLFNHVSFSQEDLTALSFPDASYDYVFSWGVVIHIPRADLALRELSRIVRPGGKLALCIVNQSALDNRIEALARSVTRKPLNIKDRQLGDGIQYKLHDEDLWLWQFDMDRVSNLLASEDLRLISRRTCEFTEFQRRLTGAARSALMHLNNFAYRSGFPPSLSRSNILIFEKQRR